MTFRALVIGDCHFDKLKNLFPYEHLHLQIAEIEKVYNYAIKNGYNRIIWLGDVGEFSRLSYEALCLLIQFFSKWDKHLKTDVILGNHDFDEHGVHSLQPFVEMQNSKFFKNLTVYDKPKIEEIDGVKINFSSYPSIKGYKDAINIGHFEVSGAIRDNGMKIKKSHTTKENHLWIMGHLHTPHEVNSVWYAGTLYQLNFGEKLPKGFLAIEAKIKEGKLKYKIKRIKNDPVFKLVNITVNSKSDLKQIDNNPYTKYKLFVKSSYDLPDNITQKYKNVVKIEGYKTKEELEALKASSFLEINSQTIELPSNKLLLKTFFKEKGLSNENYRRALEILKTNKIKVA